MLAGSNTLLVLTLRVNAKINYIFFFQLTTIFLTIESQAEDPDNKEWYLLYIY